MPVPTELPIGMSDEFANDMSRQSLWKAFLKKNHLAPVPLTAIVTRLRSILEPMLLKGRP
jgi:hypothetical protein